MAAKYYFKEWDEVQHPILGLGYVDCVKTHPNGVQYALIIEWDEDPSEQYNMATNPSLVFPCEVQLANTAK